MTQEQFEDIKKKLSIWRAERRLRVCDQKANFKVNYAEELSEFFKAERDGNEYEMIDALCDMIVVSINAGFTIENPNDWTDYPCVDEGLVSIFVNNNIDLIISQLVARGYDPYKCLPETIKELNSRTGAWNEKEGKWCKDLGAYTEEEAIKKVSDKVWSEHHSLDSVEKQKEDDDYWYFNCEIDEGYYTEEKVKKWYKADYSQCKLGEQNV